MKMSSDIALFYRIVIIVEEIWLHRERAQNSHHFRMYQESEYSKDQTMKVVVKINQYFSFCSTSET